MKQRLVFFLLGRVAVVLAVGLFIPCIYALCQAEKHWQFMAGAPLIALTAGGMLHFWGRGHKWHVTMAESARYILLNWLLVTFLGALPYALTGWLAWPDAWLQATADATTTGIILLPKEAPFSLYVWHAILGWLGAANFLTLLITMVPLAAGCFGLTVAFRRGFSFSPMLGQMDSLLKCVLGVYVTLTVAAWLLYQLAGLNSFEAIMLAFLTISTTGGDVNFYTSAPFSPALKFVMAFVFLLACGNFLRYWRTFERRDWRDYYSNREIRAFGVIIIIFAFIMAAHADIADKYDFVIALCHAFFYALSFASTAGVIDPAVIDGTDLAHFMLLILALIGGCIGSPTGGLKVFRFLTLGKLVAAETKRTLHPHLVPVVVIGGEAVPLAVSGRILAFFFLYTGAIFVFVIMLSINGIDLAEAVGLATSTFTGLGTANGFYSSETVLGLASWAKMGVCLFMILGRMEIFAFMVLVEHTMWQRKRKW